MRQRARGSIRGGIRRRCRAAVVLRRLPPLSLGRPARCPALDVHVEALALEPAMTNRFRKLAAAVLCALAAQAPALAQDFPNKPIRIVVPYPPGGQSDIFTRLIADAMKNTLNTPVTVENRAGGAGNPGQTSAGSRSA